jgi:hypothetical protein
MIEATLEAVFTLDDADAAFDSNMLTTTAPEPGLPLIALSGTIFRTALRKHNPLYTQLLGKNFVAK